MTTEAERVEQPLPRDQANFIWIDERMRKMHGAPPAPSFAPEAARAVERKRKARQDAAGTDAAEVNR